MWTYIIFIYLSLILESVTAKYYRDKSGWIYFEKTGYRYKRFDEQAKFNEAIRLCQKYGAQLASIHSEEENDFIYQISKRNKNPGKGERGSEFMWIGLRKVDDEWVWVDETKVDYTAWAKYQPDDWKGVEKCGQ
ncbi:lectin C-type domain protein, partial [Ostertagia ostertagi]